MCVCTYIYIYIYIYIYTYIYTHTHTHTHTHIYIYIYIERERERDIYSRVGLIFKHWIRLERLAREKYSSLFQKPVNYGRNKVLPGLLAAIKNFEKFY